MSVQLWRLYREAHGPGLDGTGGFFAAGRWHHFGMRVVYFGASAAIVVLEKLAHLDPADLPADLLLAHYAGDISIEELSATAHLGDLDRTRDIGTKFLSEQRACALRVPSIVVPEEHNYVFNPLHAQASKLKVVDTRRFVFDDRLM